jgi:uncharacterized membrane protein
VSHTAHLWAIGYEDAGRAERVRAAVTRLRDTEQCLVLLDIAVVVRDADGSFRLDGEPFAVVGSAAGGGLSRFLARLAISVPVLTGGAVTAVLDGAGASVYPAVGIDDRFIRDVAVQLKPGTSALFVLDDEGDMDAILRAIRGLGGTVMRTNVNLERAKLIQSTLLADPGNSAAHDET